jgi:hypothetical protein
MGARVQSRMLTERGNRGRCVIMKMFRHDEDLLYNLGIRDQNQAVGEAVVY